MKHIKTFEGLFSNFRKDLEKRTSSIGLGVWQWGVDNNEENIGKFVIIQHPSSDLMNVELHNFLQTNIGEITMASKSGYGISYMVKYNNIPPNLQGWFSQNQVWGFYDYLVCMDQHLEFVGTYEECKFYLEAKTYNL